MLLYKLPFDRKKDIFVFNHYQSKSVSSSEYAVTWKVLELSNQLMEHVYKLVKQSGLQNIQSFVIASHQWLESNYGDAKPEEEKKEEEDEGETDSKYFLRIMEYE